MLAQLPDGNRRLGISCGSHQSQREANDSFHGIPLREYLAKIMPEPRPRKEYSNQSAPRHSQRSTTLPAFAAAGPRGGLLPLFRTCPAPLPCQPPSAAPAAAVGWLTTACVVAGASKPSPRRPLAAQTPGICVETIGRGDPASGVPLCVGRRSDAGPRPLGWPTTGCAVGGSIKTTPCGPLAVRAEWIDNSYRLSQNGQLLH